MKIPTKSRPLLALLVLGVLWVQLACSPSSMGSPGPATSGTPGAAVGTASVRIPVEGMSCSSCAASVKRAVRRLEGVASVDVDLAARQVLVGFVDGKVSPERIAAAIRELGYQAGTPIRVKAR